MALIAYTYIDVNVNNPDTSYPLVIAKQNDTGRGICASLYSDGELLDPTGNTCQIYIVKPDGTKVYQQFTVSNKRVYITLTNNTLAVPGICKAEIMYTSGEQRVTSQIFDIAVYPTNIDDSAIESTDEFTALEEAIATLSQYDARIQAIEDSSGEIHTDISALETSISELNAAITSLNTWKTTVANQFAEINKQLLSVNLMPWPMHEIQGSEITKNNIRSSTKMYGTSNYYGVSFSKTTAADDVSDTSFSLTSGLTLPAGIYNLSGNPGGGGSGSSRKWALGITVTHSGGTTTNYYDDGNGVTFGVLDSDTGIHVFIKFYAANFGTQKTFETGIFKPMLAIGHEKQPYTIQFNALSLGVGVRTIDLLTAEIAKLRSK